MAGGTEFHADRETYAEAYAQLWLPAEVDAGLSPALRVPVQRQAARAELQSAPQ